MTAIISRNQGGGITITEQDGAPLVYGVSRLKFANGIITDNGGGIVSIGSGAAGGGSQFWLKETMTQDYGNSTARGATAQAQGGVFEVSSAGHVDGIMYIPGAVISGNVRAAVYGPLAARNVVNGEALLIESASVAQADQGGYQIIPLTSTALAAGQYVIFLQFSSATATFRQHENNGLGLLALSPYFNQAFGAFPATVPAVSTDLNSMPFVLARMTGA